MCAVPPRTRIADCETSAQRWSARRSRPVVSGTTLSRLGVAGYFTMLDLGYLSIEIAVLQRVILFTGTPVLAASIVFAIFLIGPASAAR
jgi:hypothetical protein